MTDASGAPTQKNLLPWGVAARRAFTRTVAEVAISLAAVPLLVNFASDALSGQRVPWWSTIVTAAIIVVVFFGFAIAERRQGSLAVSRGPARMYLMKDDEVRDITDIVTVAPARADPPPPPRRDPPKTPLDRWDRKPIGNLAHKAPICLPNLKKFHIVVAEEDCARDDFYETTADEFKTHHNTHAEILGAHPTRFIVRETDIQALAEALMSADRDAAGKLAVDITADTKPMTLTLFLAAQRAGLPVTYLMHEDGEHPDRVYGLSPIAPAQRSIDNAPTQPARREGTG